MIPNLFNLSLLLLFAGTLHNSLTLIRYAGIARMNKGIFEQKAVLVITTTIMTVEAILITVGLTFKGAILESPLLTNMGRIVPMAILLAANLLMLYQTTEATNLPYFAAVRRAFLVNAVVLFGVLLYRSMSEIPPQILTDHAPWAIAGISLTAYLSVGILWQRELNQNEKTGMSMIGLLFCAAAVSGVIRIATNWIPGVVYVILAAGALEGTFRINGQWHTGMKLLIQLFLILLFHLANAGFVAGIK